MSSSCMLEVSETFNHVTREGVMVSTHIAWGCYPTSVTKGFLGPEHKVVEHTVPRFCMLNFKGLEGLRPQEIIHGKGA